MCTGIAHALSSFVADYLRFAIVIPWLYSDHDSDNNSECSALFCVRYKGQAEQQTPKIGRSPPAPTREVTPFINGVGY